MTISDGCFGVFSITSLRGTKQSQIGRAAKQVPYKVGDCFVPRNDAGRVDPKYMPNYSATQPDIPGLRHAGWLRMSQPNRLYLLLAA